MRALLIHSRDTWFRAVRKALRDPPDPPREAELGECLVVFVTVEDGDTPGDAERLARDAIEQAGRIGVKCILIYPFAHLSNALASPGDAYRILSTLEETLRERWDGRVERAPFGWYKAFRINCVGHPLCELSREYRGTEPLYSPDGASLQTLAEALKSGLMPNLDSGQWPQETSQVLARFGLEPPTSGGLELSLGALAHTIGWYPHPSTPVYEAPRGSIARKPWLSLVLTCLNFLESRDVKALYRLGNQGIVAAQRDPWSLEDAVGLPFSMQDRISELGVSSKPVGSRGLVVPWYADFTGSIYYYTSPGGRSATLAARVEGLGREAYCVGPSINVMAAMVDYALHLARGGWTPYLPFWASPVHAAVIPVKENHMSFAEEVAYELSTRGLRAYLDPPTRGLGARIRAAGRLWALYVVVIGDREMQSRTLSIRRRVEGDQVTLSLDEFVDEILRRALEPPSPLHPLRGPPQPRL